MTERNKVEEAFSIIKNQREIEIYNRNPPEEVQNACELLWKLLCDSSRNRRSKCAKL